MLNKLTTDWDKANLIAFRYETIEQRLLKLEYLNGVNESKPKVFEEIYNKISDVSCNIKNL